MAVLRELGIYRIDFQHHAGKEERRLTTSVPAQGHIVWPFIALDVIWPHGGAFFQPEALSCLPEAAGSRSLLMSSPFAVYLAEGIDLHRLRLIEQLEERFPPGTLAFCGWDANLHCLLGALTSEGLAVWRWGSTRTDARLIPVAGKPWRKVTGVLSQCIGEYMADMLNDERVIDGASSASRWCLVLAGWDGKRLPVASVLLPLGPGSLPSEGARIRPRFSVPLAGALQGNSASEVAALQLVPRRGRLWAALGDGSLQAWNILQPKWLGIWHPHWPLGTAEEGFKVAAICEEAGGPLLVAGESPSGPLLLRSETAAACAVDDSIDSEDSASLCSASS